MTETDLKDVKGRRSPPHETEMLAPTSKRPRTAEDFYLFCSFILEYEKYGVLNGKDVGEKIDSPLGSTGSVAESMTDSLIDSVAHSPTHSLADSVKSEPVSATSVEGVSNSPDDIKTSDIEADEDSYDLVTCYCAKPFAGRAMIECSKCLTWIHLSCAKIKKKNIPDVFICIKCKNQKSTNIPTNSLKAKKRVSV